MPTLPQNCEAAVVEVASKFPTVSCELVASIFPEAALYHSGMLAPSVVLFVPPLAIGTVPERYAVVSTDNEPAVDLSKPVPEAAKLESVEMF